jgi:hypothetical protein
MLTCIHEKKTPFFFVFGFINVRICLSDAKSLVLVCNIKEKEGNNDTLVQNPILISS